MMLKGALDAGRDAGGALGNVRQTEWQERALIALGLAAGQGGAAGGNELVQALGRRDGPLPQPPVEDHIGAPPPRAVEQGPRGNLAAQHLFEADRLGTKLHAIAIVLLGLATLVLDWHHGPSAAGEPIAPSAPPCQPLAGNVIERAKLNHVGLADESQRERPQRQAASDPQIALAIARFLMGLAMQMLPLNRQPVLGPLLLDVDERALPLTKQQVLEGGDREEIVFGEHD